MDSSSQNGPTFSLDVSSAGAASLRHTVMMKLSEFMGSYTDEVLAEYVVVLVGHGKQRAQAIKDLEAFLGDQSEGFVTWLWEHLCSNIHLYTSVSKGSSPPDGFGSTDQLELDQNKETVIKSLADAQSEDKNHVQVSSVTHDFGRPARVKKDSTKDVSLKAKTNLNMGSSFSGREKTGLSKGDFESGRIANNYLNRDRGSMQSAKRPRSPDSRTHRERNLSDERHNHKRHLSPPRVNATRRLLQSAVREAVAPATSRVKRLESLKRLRSVVSADVENSESTAGASVKQPLKALPRNDAARQGIRAVPAMIVAMKAAAAAAEDATKVRGRSIGSVWDRLGKNSAEAAGNKEGVIHELLSDGFEDRDVAESRFVGTNQHGNEYRAQKRARLGSEDRLSKGSTEDDVAACSDPMINEYTEGHSTGDRSVYAVKSGKHQTGERSNEDFMRDLNGNEGQRLRTKDRLDKSQEESVTVQYRLAQNMDRDVKETHKQKGLKSSSGANSSQKIVNISVNVNTWKPRPFDMLKDVASSEQPTLTSTLQQPQDQPDKAADTDMLQIHDANEIEEEAELAKDINKRTFQLPLETTKLHSKQLEVAREGQKVVPPSVIGVKQGASSQEDKDIRTVFVANIHFAANKESVMAHFNRCGDIERIVMLTDGATGLPKGSAYIEFNTKDAAEKALALNDSSFYSRALKVVRKDAANQAIQETTPLLVRPTVIRRPIPLSLRVPLRGRFLRGSPYLLGRFPSMPRPYGHSPNLQWKRDAIATGGIMNPSLLTPNRPGYGPLARPARSLSYVRSTNSPNAQNLATTEEHKPILQQGESNEIKPDATGGLEQEQRGDTVIEKAELEQVAVGD